MEQGELFFDVIWVINKCFEVVLVCICDSEEEVFGELKVIMIIGFGIMWLVLCLFKFYEKYFDFKIDFMFEECVFDLFMCEVDVVICMKELSQVDLICKWFMNIWMCFYVIEEYFVMYLFIEIVIDIYVYCLICQSLNIVQVVVGVMFVQFLLNNIVVLILIVNNYFGGLQVVFVNVGVGVLLDYLIEDFLGFVCVLLDVELGEVFVFFVYFEELCILKCVVVFCDFVQEEIFVQCCKKCE